MEKRKKVKLKYLNLMKKLLFKCYFCNTHDSQNKIIVFYKSIEQNWVGCSKDFYFTL